METKGFRHEIWVEVEFSAEEACMLDTLCCRHQDEEVQSRKLKLRSPLTPDHRTHPSESPVKAFLNLQDVNALLMATEPFNICDDAAFAASLRLETLRKDIVKRLKNPPEGLSE